MQRHLMTLEKIEKLAERIGFSAINRINMEALVTLKEVRDMCAADKCNMYGKRWSCPPSPICGNIDDAEKNMRSFKEGLLLQYTENMKNPFDYEAIRNAEKTHKKMFEVLVYQVRITGTRYLALGSGACTRCYTCTYPDKPCRYPDKLYPSMEAYGLMVSDVCARSGVPYNYGTQAMTFTACILI